MHLQGLFTHLERHDGYYNTAYEHTGYLGQTKRAIFKPGMAIIHRGSVPHAAHPITSGKRTNMVLWLYGDNMQVPRGVGLNSRIDATQRWTDCYA